MWKTTTMQHKFANRKNKFGSFLILEYEQIVEILIHSSIENFQPGLQPNNEQKVDEMHVTPS